MKLGWGALAFLAVAGTALAAGAHSSVQALAGRYSRHFENALFGGETYPSDDVIEIVPLDRRNAYIRFELNFYNGHSCSLSGVAQLREDALVFTDPRPGGIEDSRACVLRIARKGDALTWTDNNSCSYYCGARGSFLGGSIPWSTRQTIRYRTRLKASPEYRDAIRQWKEGKH